MGNITLEIRNEDILVAWPEIVFFSASNLIRVMSVLAPILIPRREATALPRYGKFSVTGGHAGGAERGEVSDGGDVANLQCQDPWTVSYEP